MSKASNSVDLLERVEEFLGSEASETDVVNAIEILKDNGFNFGDNINDYWPDDMLELLLNLQIKQMITGESK
jgi:dihydropteroate synthase